LKIGFEKILEPAQKSIGVETKPRYERLGAEAKTVYQGRPDAVHGQVIIEYEPPKAFSSNRAMIHAFNQLVDYISAESRSSALNRLAGVGFDGYSIFFVKYQGKPNGPVNKESFVRQGPYPFNPETARTLLTYLRALARLPLTAENLAQKFGPKSEIAPMAVSAFADALEHWGSDRVRVFFEEWKRLFGIVYGERFSAHQPEEATVLAQLYQVGRETDFQELLFSVHTYFALLMKFISAELLSLKETAFSSSFSHELTHTAKEELKAKLTDIEDGGIYTKQGITNLLEGDFFRWYLDAFSPRLEEAIREMTRALSEFEPATTFIEPESSRDLLKKLYQYLVPQEVRHNLGEYYTPDWLAELILKEVDYDGNTLKRVLDPACGSGTFLVLAIQRAKEYGRLHKEPPLETVKRIIANIWGFDLNPLAVIAARTNYLFALGELTQQLPSLEIPIYLADSVLWPERSGQTTLNFAGGDHVKVQTSIGKFHVPLIWIKDKGFLMSKAAPLVEDMAKQKYTDSEAMARFSKEGLAFPPHESVILNFYKEISELEKKNKNGIWARFLKNAFAPMVAGEFDFVIGNPPWIRWDFLSQEYRNATLQLWKNYGLFSLKGFESRLGGGKKDFSMLFVYAVADYYLKKDAKLGFLITQEVFKSKGAGEGFRKFQLGDRELLKVIKAHDLVSIQPFEGATNKTAAIILKKEEKTRYPVPYIVWNKKKGVGKIATDKLLNEVLPLLQKKKYNAKPIGSNVGAWQTNPVGSEGLENIEGGNFYHAHSGAYISPYGVFWLQVEQVLANSNVIVKNLAERGKTKISEVIETIENDLIYPALRGSDIKRWQASPQINILLTQDPSKREPYPESEIKARWPRTYGYLTKFRNVLLNRASRVLKDLMAKTSFYAVFGVADYTMANYKVVWKRMTNDLIATVISQFKTPFGYKTIIPLETTALIATNNESEAHYLCAIINSNPVRDFIKSFSSAGRGFGTPSVMQYVGIPKFNPKNTLHKNLAQISKILHQLKAKNELAKIPKLEEYNNKLVSKLFGIKG
jgi:SAM-dependent methyltransferase